MPLDEEPLLQSFLTGNGGENLRRYVNDLIRATASKCAVNPSDIILQSIGNIRDGGVDAECRVAFPNDPTGWFGTPTAWQLKSSQSLPSQSAIETGLQQPYMKTLIKQGFVVRWAVNCHAQPDRITTIEEQMMTCIIGMGITDAPSPRLIALTQLLDWERCFPAIGLKRRGFDDVNPFEQWKDLEIQKTTSFVLPESWSPIQNRIIEFCDLSKTTSEGVLTLYGVPGVGKNRLALESIAKTASPGALVMYARDAALGRGVLTRLHNDAAANAILVVDECEPEDVINLKRDSCPVKGRVRVLAITNIAGPPSAGLLILDRMTDRDMESVIERNFPTVIAMQRGNLARMSGGFVRFAVDLCESGAFENPDRLGVAHQSVLDHIRRRLGEDSVGYRVVLAFALFAKVGISGEVGQQLARVCARFGIDENDARHAVRTIKDRYGFITVQGRYAYVAAQVVADAAAPQAWRWWIADDPSSFMEWLTDELRIEFEKQLGRTGQEVRAGLATHFRSEFDRLIARGLSDATSVERVCVLVRYFPETLLKPLRAALERLTDEKSADRDADDGTVTSTHRHLADACLTLTGFPEYFADAEAILYRLATAASRRGQHRIASQSWASLYSMNLSGTSVPLQDRLAVIRARLASASPEQARVLCEGLFRPFADHHSRSGRDAVIAGRLVPNDWRPETYGDRWDAQRLALTIGCEAASRSDALGAVVRGALADELPGVMKHLRIPEIRTLIGSVPFSRTDKDTILEGIDAELARHDRVNEPAEHVLEWLNEIRALRDEFASTEVLEQARALFSRNEWHPSLLKDRIHDHTPSAEAVALGEAVAGLPEIPDEFLDWMFGPECYAARVLGRCLGMADPGNRLLPVFFERARRTEYFGVLEGYLRVLSKAESSRLSSLHEELDALGAAVPLNAFEIAAMIGDPVGGFERCLALVDGKKVPPEHLRRLSFWIGRRRTTVEERLRIVRVLHLAAADGNANAWRSLLDLIGMPIYGHNAEDDRAVLANEIGTAAAWYLVESASKELARDDAHYVFRLLLVLLDQDPDRAANCLLGLIRLAGHSGKGRFTEIFKRLSEIRPDLLMEQVGAAALDRILGYIDRDILRSALEIIPIGVIESWLNVKGASGAEALASHLPKPYRDGTNPARLPAIVELIFRSYPGNEKISDYYAMGLYGSGSYFGNPAITMRKDAELLREFSTHPDPSIRAWATKTAEWREHQAEMCDKRHREDFLP
jgi:hypothetical protein